MKWWTVSGFMTDVTRWRQINIRKSGCVGPRRYKGSESENKRRGIQKINDNVVNQTLWLSFLKDIMGVDQRSIFIYGWYLSILYDTPIINSFSNRVNSGPAINHPQFGWCQITHRLHTGMVYHCRYHFFGRFWPHVHRNKSFDMFQATGAQNPFFSF